MTTKEQMTKRMRCVWCAQSCTPNTRPGEKWVQCIQCKGWVHEECADIGFALTFTCQNCNSDDSDYAYSYN